MIAGLGNIGAEYADTRHNIGFKVLDALAGQTGGVFKTERYGDVCEIRHKGRTLVLLKPSTYMNLSGKAVNYWMQKEKIEAERLFVVVDDLALPFGAIRLRMKGSDGGHNGLKNINEMLGHAVIRGCVSVSATLSGRAVRSITCWERGAKKNGPLCPNGSLWPRKRS